MEYKVLDTKGLEDALTFLPKQLQEILKKKDACIVGGFAEGETLACIGVFSYAAAMDEAEISYLYTMEAYREQGAAAGLLAFAKELFLQAGVKLLSCNLAAKTELAESMYDFLVANGFSMQLSSWHILVYEYMRVAQSEKLKPFQTANTMNFINLGKRQLHYLLHEDASIPQMIREIIRQEADPAASLFYLVKRQLAASVIVDKGSDNAQTVRAMYLSTQTFNKAIILSMLAQTIKKAGMGDANTAKLYFCADNSQYMALYKNLFGEPFADYWVQRYELQLVEST